MKALLLNAQARTITEIEINKKDRLKDLYKHIGCTIVEAIQIDDENAVWMDENGLLGNPENFVLFKIDEGEFFAFAGSIVILGQDPRCNSIDTNWTIDAAEELFKFADKVEVRLLARHGFIKN